jgi:hypothetical protein
MYDKALTTLPNFTKMGLHEAQQAFGQWADDTWDFNKKIESFKHSVAKSTSVKHIQAIANGAAVSGIQYKLKSLNASVK